MLKRAVKKYEFAIEDIDEAIIEALVADRGMTEEKAIDDYFASKTYARLIDETTDLYLKPWTEIYQLLLRELKK
jgi:hypothetical protein